MKNVTESEIKEFVEQNIQLFHANRLKALSETELKDLLKKKNPYLFRAKNILTAQDLVASFLDAKLSSSEEKIFGDFLENLALFIATKTLNASKSSSHGVDFEYTKNKTRYLVTVKSGSNWGNSSQWGQLLRDFQTAIKVLKQSPQVKNVECILGIGYGKAKLSIRRGIIKIINGQTFWYMISGKENFYKEIVNPIGYKSKEHNELFNVKKAELINKFTKEFVEEFCDKEGKILWNRLVEFNSENLTEEDKRFI